MRRGRLPAILEARPSYVTCAICWFRRRWLWGGTAAATGKNYVVRVALRDGRTVQTQYCGVHLRRARFVVWLGLEPRA
jgi:hypothetical protein